MYERQLLMSCYIRLASVTQIQSILQVRILQLNSISRHKKRNNNQPPENLKGNPILIKQPIKHLHNINYQLFMR